MLYIKRIYDYPAAEDGYRVLIDGRWPRGVKKEDARIDEWRRDVVPSIELRRWYARDPNKWVEFRRRYFTELDTKPAPVKALREKARRHTVTLLFGARDRLHSETVALLKAYLQETTED